MIKYLCVATTKCNFVIARVEMKPVFDNGGNLLRYTTDESVCPRSSLTQNTISWWKIRGGHNLDRVFDTLPEAENYVKSQMDSEKDKHVKKFENYIKYYQKLLDKILDHNPKIRHISLVK